MPYKKRPTYRRRRKTTYRKKRVMRPRRSPSLGRNLMLVKGLSGIININTPVPVANSTYQQFVTFSLNALSNSVDLCSTFDQYKICAVKVFYRLKGQGYINTSVGATPSAQVWLGDICSALDFDGVATSPITTEASCNTMREYKSFKVSSPRSIHTRYLRPKIAMLENTGTGISTQFTSPQSVWISTDNPAVPHNGIWLGVFNNNTNQIQNYEYWFQLYVMFRNVK